jgi:hypothetical protein
LWQEYLNGDIRFDQIEAKAKPCLELIDSTFAADIDTVLKIMKYSKLGGANRYFVSKLL